MTPTEDRRADILLPAGVRLSRRGARPQTARMKRFLKSLGVAGAAYMAWTGGQPFNAFAAANPDWTQRAWEILVAENLETLRHEDTDDHGVRST